LKDYGIQRDSTVYVSLATHLDYGRNCALPTSLRVEFTNFRSKDTVTVECKTGDTVGDIGIRAVRVVCGYDDEAVIPMEAVRLIHAGRHLCSQTRLAYHKFSDSEVLFAVWVPHAMHQTNQLWARQRMIKTI